MYTVVAKCIAGIPRCFGNGHTITEATAQCLLIGTEYLSERKDIDALYLYAIDFDGSTKGPIWEDMPTQVTIRQQIDP